MLPAKQRLQSRWLFRKTLNGLRYYACPSFVIMTLAHWNEPYLAVALATTSYRPRVGFVISKKVDKRATKRNRLKRIAREHLRQHILPALNSGELTGIASMAIIFRPAVAQTTEATLLQQLNHAFSPRHLSRLNRQAQSTPTCTTSD